jgi:hypothetical protein
MHRLTLSLLFCLWRLNQPRYVIIIVVLLWLCPRFALRVSSLISNLLWRRLSLGVSLEPCSNQEIEDVFGGSSFLLLGSCCQADVCNICAWAQMTLSSVSLQLSLCTIASSNKQLVWSNHVFCSLYRIRNRGRVFTVSFYHRYSYGS